MPDFFFDLPPSLVAQTPASPRDDSRLLTINRTTGQLGHYHFYDLPRLLLPDDVLVFNQTRVIPARLFGHKTTGGKVEILLLRNTGPHLWEFISHPGLKSGQVINFAPEFTAQVVSPETLKLKIKNLPGRQAGLKLLDSIGHTPIPPYIHSQAPETTLRRQYQTVYAKTPGSAAAPTAGLHFTKTLLKKLPQPKEFLTLHVGLGTFQPPSPSQIASGSLHHEYFELPPGTAARLNAAKAAGRRIIAVGTTTTRVLESCADPTGLLIPRSGDTDIFIRPPYKFKFVDGLITNFHLPGSSLIMLVSAFSSWPIIQNAYSIAIKKKYRFYSFGDATFIS